jgi:hypothetical protein
LRKYFDQFIGTTPTDTFSPGQWAFYTRLAKWSTYAFPFPLDHFPLPLFSERTPQEESYNLEIWCTTCIGRVKNIQVGVYEKKSKNVNT